MAATLLFLLVCRQTLLHRVAIHLLAMHVDDSHTGVARGAPVLRRSVLLLVATLVGTVLHTGGNQRHAVGGRI